MKRIFEVNPWTITSHELQPADKRLQESMTSLGNEYMGMRGMFEETYSGDSLQGVYIGGVWFPDKTRVGWWKIGYPEYFGKAINALNFVKAIIQIDGVTVDLATVPYTDFEVSLWICKQVSCTVNLRLTACKCKSIASSRLQRRNWLICVGHSQLLMGRPTMCS